MIHVDTHALVWIYAGERGELSRHAQEVIEGEDLVASPMAVLEMELLHQIQRTTVSGKRIVDTLADQIGLRVSTTPFLRVVESAAALAWTRDPFDRLIVGTAIADGARLLTKDRTILRHFEGAVWEGRAPKRRKR